ncbi:glycosyltransferase family 1 protein [Mycolicibacterium sp.]|uniref:glycosyltransferase family 4 protein n=1 Tax=Mycolicibacterium sp. TaxID=2320850 RepID=UPI001A2CE781|nr:glycosyltransferase family 1 protein [Mycolicibacterium sp.]MBJ7339124.1 glycosyltransferase family 4 protein [Mycolicibacterium sp.]
MKIAIDNVSPGISTAPGGKGGMRMYLESLLTEMLRAAPEHRFVLLTPDWNASFDIPDDPRLEVVPLRSVPRSRMQRVIYERTAYPSAIRRAGCDVFLGLCNTLPPLLNIPSAVVIQSTQFQFVPEAYGFLQRHYLRLGVASAVRAADAVITVSEHSRQDVIGWLGTDPRKVTSVLHGVFFSSTEVNRPVPTAERPYILCVSAFYPYKNLFRLIEAFSILKGAALPHELVIVGGDTPGVTRADLLAHARALGVEDAVRLPGRVSQDELEEFYRGADVFVMPSLYETFGLPVLEAMALGCPVVAARASSLPEVAGDAAELVDPLSPDSIAHGLAAVITSPSRRAELVGLGRERVTEFSWEKAAKQTVEVLETVAARRGITC